MGSRANAANVVSMLELLVSIGTEKIVSHLSSLRNDVRQSCCDKKAQWEFKPTEIYSFRNEDKAEDAEVTDDPFGTVVSAVTDTIRLPRRSTRLDWRSIPEARRLLAIRLSALARALGALGQRTERRVCSLTMSLSRTRSSAVLPLKPYRASSRSGS